MYVLYPSLLKIKILTPLTFYTGFFVKFIIYNFSFLRNFLLGTILIFLKNHLKKKIEKGGYTEVLEEVYFNAVPPQTRW